MTALHSNKLRWAYMDHWRVDTPQGQVSQYSSVKRFDNFLRQISAIGYEAIETFDFHLGIMRELFGSLENTRSFMQERGVDKVLSLFHAVMYDERQSTPHVRATHDHMFNYAQHIMKSSAGLGVENFIVMPAGLYYDVEPVTDDKIRACAEFWSRVGKMTLDYGVKTCCHHEFFCGIRTAEQLRKFYEWSDPRYVFFYCDTAQHVIAGVDPVDLYVKLQDRCGGFHLKDTHHVDLTGDYRRRPDAEVMAPTTSRWFYEMGTPEGLVDFPALFNAMRQFNYQGWVGVEHDKADLGGSNYPESTAISAWYIKHVLNKKQTSTRNDPIKWGYAVNQWKAGMTSFVRPEEIERAMKVTAACDFNAIELNAGTGRWDPLGRPENIAINFGSAEKFKLQLKDWGIDHVASLFFDPSLMSFEELHHGLKPTQRGDHAGILAQALLHAELLASIDGDCLVVQAFPSFWKEGALNTERLQTAADCWNAVGAMTQALGLKTVLHIDALSALRTTGELDQLLALCPADKVGLAFDTAELTIAGHDVVALYRRYHQRVQHFQFKDALATDTLNEYRLPSAERAMIAAGGEREIPRWFGELGTGLVNFPSLLAAMKELGYAGWVIVESDKGPQPVASSMMLNSWYLQHVLKVLPKTLM